MRPSRPGFVVALEGIDGTGKTVLAAGLRRALHGRRLPVVPWKEPRDPYFAARAASATSSGRWEEAALAFTLDRALAQGDLIRLVTAGKLVLSDRSLYSTLAYQAPALGPAVRRRVVAWQRQLAQPPDLVLWLKLPVEEALARLALRPGRKAPWEARETLERAHRAYGTLARRTPRTFRVVDARPPLRTVVLVAAALVEEAWRCRGRGPAP